MDLSAVHAALAAKSYADLAPLCDDLFLLVRSLPSPASRPHKG
jgi:hypothetical protein